MTGKPKYHPTIGVVVRDPDQKLFKEMKKALDEDGKTLMMRADQVFGRHPSTGCKCPMCEAGIPITRIRQFNIAGRVYQVKVKDMSLTWKDTTSYSHGERGKKHSTTWSTTIGDGLLNITVVYGHIHYPNIWVFHCHELNFDTVPLPGVTDAAQAQFAALEVVRFKLEQCLTALMSQWPGK